MVLRRRSISIRSTTRVGALTASVVLAMGLCSSTAGAVIPDDGSQASRQSERTLDDALYTVHSLMNKEFPDVQAGILLARGTIQARVKRNSANLVQAHIEAHGLASFVRIVPVQHSWTELAKRTRQIAGDANLPRYVDTSRTAQTVRSRRSSTVPSALFAHRFIGRLPLCGSSWVPNRRPPHDARPEAGT